MYYGAKERRTLRREPLEVFSVIENIAKFWLNADVSTAEDRRERSGTFPLLSGTFPHRSWLVPGETVVI